MTDLTLPPPSDLLRLPAAEGARRIAITFVEVSRAAGARLEDADDGEALHDVRVALRRLRSWVGVLNEELGGKVRRRHRRRLRRLSRVAGAARDAEVHLAWLQGVEELLRPRERPGAGWLIRRAANEQRSTFAAVRAAVDEDFEPALDALLADLAMYTIRIDLRQEKETPTLGHAVAPLMLIQADALGERLASVQSVQDQAVAHAARIAGKRLRYLLEPLADAIDGGPELIKRLRHLQDTIGEMHDVQVMAEAVIQAAEDAAAEQARRVATALLEGDASDEAVRRERARDPRAGLLAVAAQLRSRGVSAFTQLQTRWLGDHARDLTNATRALAGTLVVGERDTLARSIGAVTTPQSSSVPANGRSPAAIVEDERVVPTEEDRPIPPERIPADASIRETVEGS